MVLSFVFVTLVVLLDQLFKRLIVMTLSAGGEIVLIPQVIGLVYVRNYGAAFGILQDMRWPLAGIQLVLCLFLVAVLLRYNAGFWGKLGLSAFLGGGIGNLIDRVIRGYVVDMFELQFVNFAVFNIADIFITLGGIVFFVNFLFSGSKKNRDDELPDNVTEFPTVYDEAKESELEDILSEMQTAFPSADARNDAAEFTPVPEISAVAYDLPDIETVDFSSADVPEDEFDLNKILSEYGLESDDS